jgi:hypothetical protein
LQVFDREPVDIQQALRGGCARPRGLEKAIPLAVSRERPCFCERLCSIQEGFTAAPAGGQIALGERLEWLWKIDSRLVQAVSFLLSALAMAYPIGHMSIEVSSVTNIPCSHGAFAVVSTVPPCANRMCDQVT